MVNFQTRWQHHWRCGKKSTVLSLFAFSITLEKLNRNPQACPLPPAKKIFFFLGDITGSSYSLNRCSCTLSRTCLFHGFSLLFPGTGSAHGFDVLLEIQNRTIVLIKRNNWRIYGTGARHEKVLRLLTTNIPWCVTSRAQICLHELWLRLLFSRNGRLFSLAGKRPVIRGRESVNTPHFTLLLKEYGW